MVKFFLFLLKSELEPHQQLHREGLEQAEERKRPSLECRECGAEFTNHAMLSHHMKVHKKVLEFSLLYVQNKRIGSNNVQFVFNPLISDHRI